MAVGIFVIISGPIVCLFITITWYCRCQSKKRKAQEAEMENIVGVKLDTEAHLKQTEQGDGSDQVMDFPVSDGKQ